MTEWILQSSLNWFIFSFNLKIKSCLYLICFDTVIFQLTTPSSLLDSGIYRLHTVTSILGNFEFEAQLFVNPKIEKEEKETRFFSGTFEGEV